MHLPEVFGVLSIQSNGVMLLSQVIDLPQQRSHERFFMHGSFFVQESV